MTLENIAGDFDWNTRSSLRMQKTFVPISGFEFRKENISLIEDPIKSPYPG
jgi:hypothetical protein